MYFPLVSGWSNEQVKYNEEVGDDPKQCRLLGWRNKQVKYDEEVRDDPSSTNDPAKGDEGLTKVQGLPHRHPNLRIIDLFIEVGDIALVRMN